MVHPGNSLPISGVRETYREGVTRRSYGAHQLPPPGYAVEFWDSDEHWHWVRRRDPDDTYGDATWNHWAAWRGAWAHYETSKSRTPQAAEEIPG